MWDLPRPGREPVSPALVGGLFILASLGKPSVLFLKKNSDLETVGSLSTAMHFKACLTQVCLPGVFSDLQISL